MSRNGSGTQTTPNTFVAGTPITASDHNENWADAAAEITNSVAADGQTTMTGALKAASGTVASPGLAFGADTDTGIYRIGSNTLGVAAGGAKVLDVSSTGLGVTGTLDATAVNQGGAALVPAGIIWLYGGVAAPTGFLFCAGQSLLRTDYAALFTAIGTTYGALDGTHFSLPDLRGRVPAGDDNMGGSTAGRLTTTMSPGGTTLGAVGGAETIQLTLADLPTITSSGSNSISVTTTVADVVRGSVQSAAVPAGGAARIGSSNVTGDNTVTSTGSNSISVTSSGTLNGSHNNVQPTLILNYIIKT